MANLLLAAWRSVRRDPAVSLTVIAVLAVASGACATVFSALDAILLRPLPYRDPGRLVLVWSDHPVEGRTQTSTEEFDDWRAGNHVFEDMAATNHASWNLTGSGDADRLSGEETTTNFFSLLGVRMILGRPFLPEEAEGRQPRAAILSYELWRRKFGGSPDVLGRTIELNRIPVNIVGVASPDLPFPESTDIWTPAQAPARSYGRRNMLLKVVGRLKPGVSLREAESNMRDVAKALESQYPATNTNWSVALTPLDQYIAGDAGRVTALLFGAVLLVVLIACANVANLLLARSTERQTEIAVRTALGASRRQLFCEFLLESAALSLPALALGLAIAAAGSRALAALPIPHAVRLHDARIDLAVFGCAAALALLTTLLFALVPLIGAGRIDVQGRLKETNRHSAGSPHRSWLRRALVAAEFALSVVLLAGAGLLIRTLINLNGAPLGFRPSNVLTMRIIRTSPDSAAFIHELLDRVQHLAGVRSAGAAVSVPLSGRDDVTEFRIEGRPAPPPGQPWTAGLRLASPRYFETMGIPLLRGRNFMDRDDEAPGHERVAIVNQTLARRYFPDMDPIGQRVSLGGWRTIVGVVGDVRHAAVEASAAPEIYAPYQLASAVLTLALRTDSDPLSYLPAVRAQVAALDPNQAVFGVNTMDELVAAALATRRDSMALIAVFAALAMVFAVIGVYSVTSYSVARRTGEIGIRIALGAGRGDIGRMIISETSWTMGAGIFIGLAGAAGLTRLLTNMLYGVSPLDPAVMAAAAAVLAALGIAAAIRPAVRAGKVDPVSAIRAM
jgi:putative ABC transport system permease protein